MVNGDERLSTYAFKFCEFHQLTPRRRRLSVIEGFPLENSHRD